MILINRSIIIIYIVFSSSSYAQDVVWTGVDLKGNPCMARKLYHGKIFDYSKERGANLAIVEEYHFTNNIQMLQKGNTGDLLNDIHYTIEAFPNHYKALNSLIYYQLIYQFEIKKGIRRPVNPAIECYFERAIKFFPGDDNIQILYAIYLKKNKHYKLADKHYKRAIEMSPDNLNYRYIYGLFLVKQKKYELANEQAKIIYSKKFPGQKLKQKLIAVKAWKQ